MERIFETIGVVAPTRATVLLQGESGTGKELLARTVHRFDGVADDVTDSQLQLGDIDQRD